METIPKNLAHFEGKRAKNYDGFVQQWIPNYDYFMSVLPKLLSTVDTKKLLAVGCGTGNEIAATKDHDASWRITGVDPSPEMIHIAKRKLANYANVDLFTGEVGQLKPQSHFGAATLLLVLHFIRFPNQRLALLTEIQKRLQPGAPLIIMGILCNRAQLKGNLNVLRSLLPPTIHPDEVEERVERITNNLHRTSEGELEKLLLRAGFERPTRFFQASIYSGWVTKKCDN